MTPASNAPPDEPVQRPVPRPRERSRGRWGMALFICTEGMLFVFLFFAYFYLGAQRPEWPPGEDPSVRFVLPMLGVLLISSVVLHWGERGIVRGSVGRLKAGLVGTLLLAFVFVGLSYLDYAHHLEKLTPDMNAYASIFYSITGLHAAHLIVGMLMLGHVLVRAFAGHFDGDRHLAVGNASMYWHFVDVVWVFVVTILYLSPRLYV